MSAGLARRVRELELRRAAPDSARAIRAAVEDFAAGRPVAPGVGRYFGEFVREAQNAVMGTTGAVIRGTYSYDDDDNIDDDATGSRGREDAQ